MGKQNGFLISSFLIWIFAKLFMLTSLSAEYIVLQLEIT